MERNIHDGPQQRLVRLPIDLDRAAHEIEEDPKAAQAIVHSSIVQARETLDELRALSRAIAPPILTDCAAWTTRWRSARRRQQRDPIRTLTAREREVLALMAQGHSNQAIADQLVVTIGAVEKHTQRIFTKLDLAPGQTQHRRVIAILTYLRS